MNENELKRVLNCMDKVVTFSLLNGLNVHTSVGGKYAELFVAHELLKHDPKLGQRRKEVEINRSGSCDVILAKTKKKLEVKWAVLHYDPKDPFVKGAQGIPYWGWGFSMGKQFIDRKFDYCILIAAKKDRAYPQHIFVIKCEEMTERTMGGKRKSGVFTKGSFYLEYSHDRNFYFKRKWWPKGPSPLEEDIFDNRELYERRWGELKRKGMLE